MREELRGTFEKMKLHKSALISLKAGDAMHLGALLDACHHLDSGASKWESRIMA